MALRGGLGRVRIEIRAYITHTLLGSEFMFVSGLHYRGCHVFDPYKCLFGSHCGEAILPWSPEYHAVLCAYFSFILIEGFEGSCCADAILLGSAAIVRGVHLIVPCLP